MSVSDEQSPDKRAPRGQRRERLLQPGVLPLARMVAGTLDFAERKSPVLFQRLGGKPRRTGGDLGGLITDLGKAIKDPAP